MKKLIKTRPETFIFLILFSIIICVYWGIWNFPFINFDDNQYIRDNFHIFHGITLKSVKWAFSTIYASNWHPVTWLSHMADCWMFGLNPGGHHLVNLVFHIVNTILVFLVLWNTTFELWFSVFVAALFGIHPLQVESVAWIAERKNLLSTFFWILAIWAYCKYTVKESFKWYLTTLGLFLLGLMSKPMAVTLPFTLLLFDLWPLNRFDFLKRIPSDDNIAKITVLKSFFEKIPFFIFTIASCLITLVAQSRGGSLRTLSSYPFQIRFANAAVSYVLYLKKMVWPFDLSAYYPYVINFLLWKAAPAFLILVLISFFAMMNIKKRSWFTMGWFWFLGTLVPVIGIVQVGGQTMADRYAYFSLLGIFIIIGKILAPIFGGIRCRARIVLLYSLAFFSLMALVSWNQVRYWKDTISLFQHSIDLFDYNDLANNIVGLELANKGKNKEALEYYKKTLKVLPNNKEALINMGMSFEALGRYGEAEKCYSKVLVYHPDAYSAFNNLGALYISQGKLDLAEEYYKKALRLNPGYAEALDNMGLAMLRKGELRRGIYFFKRAVKAMPYSTKAIRNLKLGLKFDYMLEQAVKNLEKAFMMDTKTQTSDEWMVSIIINQVKLYEVAGRLKGSLSKQPGFRPDQFNIESSGTIKQAEEKYRRLLPHFIHILSLDQDNSYAAYNMACIYAMKGEMEQAVKYYKISLGNDTFKLSSLPLDKYLGLAR